MQTTPLKRVHAIPSLPGFSLADDWYVLDSEPNSFVLVVYRGSNDAWDGYGGGTLYTKVWDGSGTSERSRFGLSLAQFGRAMLLRSFLCLPCPVGYSRPACLICFDCLACVVCVVCENVCATVCAMSAPFCSLECLQGAPQLAQMTPPPDRFFEARVKTPQQYLGVDNNKGVDPPREGASLERSTRSRLDLL